MLKRMLERSWKGFFTRYITILLILLAINYVVQNKDTLFGEHDPNATLEVNTQDEHEAHDDHGVANVDQGDAPTPTLQVTHQVEGTELKLKFQIEHFNLTMERMDKGNKYGEGHIHLYVDGQKVTKIFEHEYVWQGLTKGEHEIKVELAHNNHEPYGVEQVFKIKIE